MTTPDVSVEVNVDESLSGNIETPKEEPKAGWVFFLNVNVNKVEKSDDVEMH